MYQSTCTIAIYLMLKYHPAIKRISYDTKRKTQISINGSGLSGNKLKYKNKLLLEVSIGNRRP